ncbi:hypothetical protein PGT21_014684 [Puccinia graminis f. sp. tritici]|uniref:PIN domain-containing protein n=1 Tax=Puccinia graminis f. sp. tritici TaxID=56615 RepID=A0A5B0NXJ5_PUCGR|nr:hypothetical protein PGTUg99_006030 [Puccinia graminis f. sp. tritici]KAA1092810.1 hypothetical protein PGT21_014684 [Puccinia graminis f. sp. tritici]
MMAQPSASSRPTTTLEPQPQQQQQQPTNQHQSKPTQPKTKPPKDGARTLLDAVTAYQRRTARAERTAGRNQPNDLNSSPQRPADLTSDTRSRPHPSSRRTQDPPSSERRDYFDSQQQPSQARSGGSPFPSKKNPSSNRNSPRGLPTPNESKLFDPKLDSSFSTSKRSSDKNRIESRSTKANKNQPQSNHTLKPPPGTLEDHESSQSNPSQASHGGSKNPPPHLRATSTQDRGWKQKKTSGRGSTAEPRQLFDPRKHDPVKFASSNRPSELSAPKNSILTLSNGDQDPISSHTYPIKDDNDEEDSKNDLIVNLKHAYKRIVSLETALKDEECAAKAKEEELRAREIREGQTYLSNPANTSSASLLRNHAQQKRHQEDYWVKLAKQHRELAETHQQFLEMALDPRLPASSHALPHKYNTPSRLWQIGFHQLLERLRHALPLSVNSAFNEQSSQLLLEHMTDFIYFAYGFYTALLEEQRLLPFKSVWVEQLGDLARYRMAVAGLTSKFAGQNEAQSSSRKSEVTTRVSDQDVNDEHDSESGRKRVRPRARRPHRSRGAGESEPSLSGSQSSRLDISSQESRSQVAPISPKIVPPRPGGSIGLAALGDWDCEEQEIWRATAKDWYAKGLADNPATGRLHHHLALLSKGDELRTLYHYCKSLTAAHPYLPARESILPFFEQEHQARRSRPEVSINDLFVHLHGMLFTKIQLDDFDSELARFMEKLTEDRFLSDKHGRRGFGRASGDIVAQSTMSNASWVMMATVNICAILQYGLEDGVIRASQQSTQKSHDFHSRNSNHKATSRGAGANAKSATIAPQAILLSHSAGVNPPVEPRKPTRSISSEEGMPSIGNGADQSNAEQFDEEHKAIMIKRTEVNDADEENDPIVFVWAAKFAFEIFKEVLQQDPSQEVCPYLAIILTFLGSLCQNRRAMKKLERFIPWENLVIYFNQIPTSVQVRPPSTLPAQESSGSSHFRLNGSPLLEDWCLRGMDWAGKGLFGRGYWKQQKTNASNGAGPGDSIGDSGRPTFIPSHLNIDSELDALVSLNGELEGGGQVHSRLGRIDWEGEEPSQPTNAYPLSSVDRWKRIAIVAGWIASSVPGIKYENNGRHTFTIAQSLKHKIDRWENEARREEDERQLAKSKNMKAYDHIAQFDEEIDGQTDDDDEDEDDDDPDDSELVKSLKARRRELKMILNQTKSASAPAVGPKSGGRKSHTGFQKNLPPIQSKAHARNKNRSKINVLPGYTTLVFDTNILIGMLTIVKDLLESEQFTIIVPLVVITELDGLKKRASDPESQSRRSGEEALEAIKYLEQSIKSYSKVLKIQTSKGNYLRDLSIRNEQINFQDFGATSNDSSAGGNSKVNNGFITTNAARNLDDVVLRATTWQLEHFSTRLPTSLSKAASGGTEDDKSDEEKTEPEKVVLLTLDRNLRLKARARGILAADEKQIISLVHSFARRSDQTPSHRTLRSVNGSSSKKNVDS